jgi:hypothetical protein
MKDGCKHGHGSTNRNRIKGIPAMLITDRLDQALTAIAELRRLNADGVIDIVLDAIETAMDRAFLALALTP